MQDISKPLYNLRLLDELAHKDTPLHRLHPMVNLLTTVIFLVVVLSFDRYSITGLLPLLIYPILVFTLAEIPVRPILHKLLPVLPIIIGIGVFNPIFDRQTVEVGTFIIVRGWITFLSIALKCGLTVTAALLLIAVTGMNNLAGALRQIRIPKLFVLQLLLTYRYITVLGEELAHMQQAYSLRAPGQRGINWRTWGPFAGQLLLRTYDRALRVYQAMTLRGFTGEYHSGKIRNLRLPDLVYILSWVSFFIVARIYNLPWLIGAWLTGVI
ncbi:MAG: cobalt ECF transporter T component CbiQ [Methylocystaceae bacterium]